MPCYISALVAVTDADVAPKKTVCKVLMPSDVNSIIKGQAHVYTNDSFGLHQPTINAQHAIISRCALGAAGELIFDVLRCSSPLAKPAARVPAEIFLTAEIANFADGKMLLKVSEYVTNSNYEFKVLINFNERMKKRYANFTPYLRVGNIISVVGKLLAIHASDNFMELTDADLNLITGLRKTEKSAPIVDLTGTEWWENNGASESSDVFNSTSSVKVNDETIMSGISASFKATNNTTTDTIESDDEFNESVSDDDELKPRKRKLRRA